MILPALALALSAVQATPLAADTGTLTGYMAHSCRLQQAANQGGTSVDYTEFCACLAGEVAQNTGDDLFRAMALGSQGALREDALIEDWEAAREDSEAIFGMLEPEEQLSAGIVIQDGLTACLPLMPAHVE